MGRFRHAGRRIAVAVTAMTLLALPSMAFAQDAIDLEFRQSTSEPLISERDAEAETSPMLPESAAAPGTYFLFLRNVYAPPRMAADLVRSGVPDTCNAAGNSEIDLNEHTLKGDVGVNSMSNAAQTDGGDSDVVATVRAEATWRRLSEVGVCSRPGERLVFSPDWDVTATLTATANDSFDEIAGDDSSIALQIAYTHRLGHSTTEDGAFQNRASLSLESSAGYGDFYDDWTVSTNNLRLGVSHFMRSDRRGSTSVGANLGHVYANPDRASYSYVGLEAAHTVKDIADGWKLRLSGSVSYREYDEVTPQREDYIYSLGATISHKIGQDTEILIGLNGRMRDSNINSRDYESINIPITLRRTF